MTTPTPPIIPAKWLTPPKHVRNHSLADDIAKYADLARRLSAKYGPAKLATLAHPGYVLPPNEQIVEVKP